MKKLTIILVLLFFVPGMAFAQEVEQFAGKFDAHLQPDMFHFYERAFAPLGEGVKYKFAEKPAKGSVLTAGDVNNETAANGRSKMLLVEPPDGMPFLAYDINANGLIEANEQFVFAPSREARNALDVSVNVPVKNSLLKLSRSLFATGADSNIRSFPRKTGYYSNRSGRLPWGMFLSAVRIFSFNILLRRPPVRPALPKAFSVSM